MRPMIRIRNLLLAAGLCLLLAGCDVFFSAPGSVAAADWEDLGFLSSGRAQSPTVAVRSNGEIYAACKPMDGTLMPVVQRHAGGTAWTPVYPLAPVTTMTYLPHLVIDYLANPEGNPLLASVDGAGQAMQLTALDLVAAAPVWYGMGGTLAYGTVEDLDFKTTADGTEYLLLWRSFSGVQATNRINWSGTVVDPPAGTYGPGAVAHTANGRWVAMADLNAGGAVSLWEISATWFPGYGTFTDKPVNALDLVALGPSPACVFTKADDDHRLWARVIEFDTNFIPLAPRDLCHVPGSAHRVGAEISAVSDGAEIFVAYLDAEDNDTLHVASLLDYTWRDLGRLSSSTAFDIHAHLAPDGDLYVSFCDEGRSGRARVFRLAH